MILKEAIYKKKRVTTRILVSEAVYGCDECHKKIEIGGSGLEMNVFHNDKDIETLNFCSWDCVLRHIPKIKSDNFMSLPFVQFDKRANSKMSANRLIELINQYFLKK